MRRNVLSLTMAIAAAAAMAWPSAAQEPADRSAVPECPAQDAVALPALAAGIRAAVDPQTGELRPPTADEARRLTEARAAAFASALEQLVMVQHEDGTVSVDLKGLFLQDVIVRKGPDGSLSYRCVPHDTKPVALEEK